MFLKHLQNNFGKATKLFIWNVYERNPEKFMKCFIKLTNLLVLWKMPFLFSELWNSSAVLSAKKLFFEFAFKNLCKRIFICFVTGAGFRHMGAPGQPLCGGLQYLKEILCKVKEIPLAVSCKSVIINKVVH